MTGRIHSIETFGTVDGPGTRLVVFVKGCPMRCQYCHNPDTWDPNGGTIMEVDEILEKYERNRPFYEGGGITVTGGEPLMQIDFLLELFTKAHKRNIHTCLDSSGIMFNPNNPELMKKYYALVKVTDLVMLDIKHIDPEEHKKLTKQENKNILAFAEFLDEQGVTIWIRHVVVPGITFNEKYLKQLGEYLAKFHYVKALDVLPYHTMGIVKYENLGIDYPLKGVPPLEKKQAIEARNIILKAMREKRAELKAQGLY